MEDQKKESQGLRRLATFLSVDGWQCVLKEP